MNFIPETQGAVWDLARCSLSSLGGCHSREGGNLVYANWIPDGVYPRATSGAGTTKVTVRTSRAPCSIRDTRAGGDPAAI